MPIHPTAQLLPNARSWLFVPGDSERKLAKAASAGADAIIIDLEDAVALDAKPQARRLARDWLQAHRSQIVEGRKETHWVRINALDSDLWREDLTVVMQAAPHGIVLPKAAGPEQIQTLTAELYEFETRNGLPTNSTRIVALASETPAAALSLGAYATATLPRLAGLTWGAEDLAAALGAKRKRDESGAWTDTFRMVRATLLLTAHAAGLLAIEAMHGDFKDLAALGAIAAAARADGFHGMLAIHPAQVPVINAAFSPSEEDLREARAIVEAFAADPARGVLSLEGKMIDRPHLAEARRLLGLPV